MSAENLTVLIGALQLVIQPQPLFPFKQYNIRELMEKLQRMLVL